MALLSYRQAERTHRADRDHSDLRSARQERDRLREARATLYAELNATARQYLTAPSDYCHALRRGDGRDHAAEALDTARAAYRNTYAQAQMTVSDPVLEALRTVNGTLGALYGSLMRLASDPGGQGPGGTPDGQVPGGITHTVESLEAEVRRGWAHLAGLRKSLRADLYPGPVPASEPGAGSAPPAR
ncbi:hypothetical protein ACWEF9_24735 [Streptomyces sp. NPDC004980]